MSLPWQRNSVCIYVLMLIPLVAPKAEAPVRTEFLRLLRISEFFGFQWQNLAEILSLFKLYDNLIMHCGHLVDWMV